MHCSFVPDRILLTDKQAMRDARNSDRELKETMVVSFDLENVITLPKTGTSNFFHKHKLNLYNLMAHASITGQGYCAIWPETLSGRGGIASALVRILTAVIADHPDVRHIVTWSDNCVPQNRNSNVAFAVAHFLQTNSQIKSIEMKYSVPGHSCIQEIDAIHSHIEHAMRVSEFYSPVSFICVLMNAKRHLPYRVLQMKRDDFREYHVPAKILDYQKIPFSKVVHLKFTQVWHKVQYKSSWLDSDLKAINIRRLAASTRKTCCASEECGTFPSVKTAIS